jgi:hypothetical protein
MHILFICGSAEVGKDGVGDYTRRLCGELTRNGHQTQLLALCDNHASCFKSENQAVEGTTILVHRIPAFIVTKQRLVWSKNVITNFQPDWISLQFVPYSFNSRGLPFWLPSFLKKLRGKHKWHIMFHELWIGMESSTSLKSKYIGLLQKRIVLKILKENKNIIINTQTELYQSKIAALGYKAMLLPLFSNIVTNKLSTATRTADILELRFCLFGSIHYGAPVEKFVSDLKHVLLQSNEKRALKFIFIGHCGAAIEEWKRVLITNKIQFEITGFVSDEEISTILSGCQYGISTTPYVLNQKSGSLTAMFDHQLSVLCVSRNWIVDGFKQGTLLNLNDYHNEDTISDVMNRKFIVSNDTKLEFVTMKFLKGLH